MSVWSTRDRVLKTLYFTRGATSPDVSSGKVIKVSNSEEGERLQHFLGSLNYYRAYIPKLPLTAESLYRLTKTGITWCWDQTCEDALSGSREA